jgi:hypothetical protein
VYIHVVRYVYIVWLYGCMRAHAHTEIFYLLYFIILYILPYIYMFWYGGRYLMDPVYVFVCLFTCAHFYLYIGDMYVSVGLIYMYCWLRQS